MGRKDFTVTERFFMLIGRELWSITVDNGLTIRTIMGLGRVDGEFSSHNFFFVNIAFAEFFLGQCRNIFWGYSACMNFFIRFSVARIYYFDASPHPPPPPPPPLHNFSNGPTLWKLRDRGATCFSLSLARGFWGII